MICQRDGCGRRLPAGRLGYYCCNKCRQRAKNGRLEGKGSAWVQVVRVQRERAERRAFWGRRSRGKMRVCLGLDCGRKFWSEGPWNRLCPSCSAANDGAVDRGVKLGGSE